MSFNKILLIFTSTLPVMRNRNWHWLFLKLCYCWKITASQGSGL